MSIKESNILIFYQKRMSTAEEFAAKVAEDLSKFNGQMVKMDIIDNNVTFTAGNDSVGIPLPDWEPNNLPD